MRRTLRRRFWLTGWIALFGSLAAFSGAHGQSLTEFALATRPSAPIGVTAGPDGAVWFTEMNRAIVGRIGPDGSIAEFPLPGEVPSGGIATGPDGALWFPATGNLRLRLGRITTSGVYSEIPLTTVGSYSGAITAGPDGALWFGAQNRVVRVTPGGSVTEFPLPPTFVVGITSGPDGNIWFSGDAYSGKITPAGEITTFPVGKAVGRISVGPDGNLWFGEWEICGGIVCGSIARVTPAGVVSEFTAPDLGAVMGIANGPDGNLWFTEGFVQCTSGGGGQCLRSPSRFGRITPDGVITQFDLSADAEPRDIVTGADGNIWFAESSADRIARVGVSSGCFSDLHSRCLNSGRFRTEVSWRVPAQGTRGLGTAITLTGDTAAFWFFSSNNLEVVVKVLDGRAVNGRFWVFVGALSDVEYEVTVTDSLTGAVRRYLNPAGTLRSIADTSAF